MKEINIEKCELPKEIEFFISVNYDEETGYPYPYLHAYKPVQENKLLKYDELLKIKIPITQRNKERKSEV